MNNLMAGAQSVERALAVLRAIASAGEAGATAAEVAISVGLNRTTAHRITAALARENMVERDAPTGRWFPGAELAVLGALAATRHGVHRHAAAALTRLAARSGDTAFLSAPSGYDSVCLAREEGAFPIRTQVLWPGQRHPLGVGAGSLALLAAMLDDKVAAIIDANRERMARAYPKLADGRLRELVERTRAEGYAVNEGMIVAGSWAVGVAIRNGRGEPVAALSLAAIESRMGEDRRHELANWLLAERAELERGAP
jgi:DNA-binding IclR family transcriptional regulator